MNKSPSIIHILIAFLLLCALVFGAYLANSNKALTNAEHCDITEGVCEVRVFNQSVRTKFEQKPVAEEELFISFSLPNKLAIERAWIEGVNMYMGKTPVMFEDAHDDTRGVTFLGSCNQAEMQWRLHAQVKNKATSEVALIHFTFYSYLD